MKRRDFLTTACLGGVVASTLSSASAQGTPAKHEYFEIRKLTVRPDRLQRVIDYHNEVLLPGLQRLGIGPVGLMVDDPQLNRAENTGLREVYAFIPYRSMDEAMSLRTKFAQEADLIAKYHESRQGTSSQNPNFTAMDRTLLQFFASVPGFKMPTQAADRVFELRIYRSFDDERNAAKISMLEEGGQMEVFRKNGIDAVFYGNAIFGTFIPNLTFLVGYENMATRTEAWNRFIADPEWHRLRDDPAYADTATEIQSIFLRPLPGSQI